MQKIRFQYQTELTFSLPASDHRFTLKILPPNDGRQRVTDLAWNVDPAGTLWRARDSFGNEALSGFIDAPHSHFRFGITGTAEMSGKPYMERSNYDKVMLYPTELTKPYGGLLGFYNEVRQLFGRESDDNDDALLERVQHFSHAVHTHMRYERGITTPATTAQEAFDIGIGVCQDFAHIMLALLRLDRIPCRYVAGLASDDGETHAWIEAWIDGRYYGIDPTRDKFIDEGYIALSKGRDFEDCSVERGIFKGACRGTQTISLNMEALQ